MCTSTKIKCTPWSRLLLKRLALAVNSARHKHLQILSQCQSHPAPWVKSWADTTKQCYQESSFVSYTSELFCVMEETQSAINVGPLFSRILPWFTSVKMLVQESTINTPDHRLPIKGLPSTYQPKVIKESARGFKLLALGLCRPRTLMQQ